MLSNLLFKLFLVPVVMVIASTQRTTTTGEERGRLPKEGAVLIILGLWLLPGVV
jgi:hypothetical protein